MSGYQLELFNKILHGVHRLSNSRSYNIEVIEHLKKNYEEFKEKYIVSFKPNRSGKYDLIGHKAYAFADLLQFPLQKEEDSEINSDILNRVKAIVAIELSLDNARMRDLKY